MASTHRFRRFCVVVLALLGGAATLSAAEPDINKLFESAKQHHAEKRYGRCMADLSALVQEIGRLRVETIKGLFPTMPSGFSAEDAEGTVAGGFALLGVGTQVKRTYRRDESALDVTIWADAGTVLQGFQMLLGNPALLGEGHSLVTVKGHKGLLEYDTEAKRGTLTIVLPKVAGMVTLSGAEFGKEELVDKLAAALDLEKIEKELAN